MKTFYILHLNRDSKGSVDRYSVMSIGRDGAMHPLWGDEQRHLHTEADNRRAAKAFPHMVFYPQSIGRPDRFPAFHFAIRGYGFNKRLELATSLARHFGESVQLFPVTGWNSSPVVGEYVGKEG